MLSITETNFMQTHFASKDTDDVFKRGGSLPIGNLSFEILGWRSGPRTLPTLMARVDYVGYAFLAQPLPGFGC